MERVTQFISVFAVGAFLKGGIAIALALILVRALRIGSSRARFAIVLGALASGVAIGGLSDAVRGAPVSAVNAADSAFRAAGPTSRATLAPSPESPMTAIGGDAASSHSREIEERLGAIARFTRPRFVISPSAGRIIAIAWIVGAAALAAYWAAGRIALARFLRRATPAPAGAARNALDRAKHRLGIGRPVRLLLCDATVPFATGALSPAICLPRDALSWDAAKLDACILHEAAHLERGDMGAMALARGALLLCWASPVAWAAYAALKRDREEAADDLVLRAGVLPSVYATVLLGFYSAYAAPNGLLGRVCGIVRSERAGSAAKERIARVLSGLRGLGARYRLRRALACIGVGAAIAAIGPARAAIAQETGIPSIEKPSDGEAAGLRLFSITAEGDSAAVTFLRDRTKNTINGRPTDFPLRKPLDEKACVPEAVSLAYGQAVSPITGKAIFHVGIDIKAIQGAAVYSTADGIVEEMSYAEDYGLYVVIAHGIFHTVYAHLSGTRVARGQAVKAGTPIGSVGDTGISTGPHLHYEIRFKSDDWRRGPSFDPALFMFRR